VNLTLPTGSYWLFWDMYNSGETTRFKKLSLYTTRRCHLFITLAIHGDMWSPSRSTSFKIAEIAPGAQTSPHFRISTFYCHLRRCWALPQNSEKRILASSCLSVHLSVRPPAWIKIGSHWRDFHEN